MAAFARMRAGVLAAGGVRMGSGSGPVASAPRLVGLTDVSRPRGRTRPVVAVNHVEPAACRVRSEGVGALRLVAAGVVGLVVVAAVWLALTVNTSDGGAALPATTTVVQVGAGETLWDVARRVVPGSPAAAVVQRIRELNGLDGSSVHVGQPLVVPDGSAGPSPGVSPVPSP